MPLTKEQKVELKDLYSSESGWAGVREMAKYFGLKNYIIKYAVNYKKYKERQAKNSRKWRELNPEKTKEMNRRAMRKYLQTEKGKIKIRKSYLMLKNNPIKYKKYLEKCRQRYQNRKKEKLKEINN